MVDYKTCFPFRLKSYQNISVRAQLLYGLINAELFVHKATHFDALSSWTVFHLDVIR